MSTPIVWQGSPLRPAQAPKPRLLLISDSPAGMRHLQCGIDPADFEITRVHSLEELRETCCQGYDLALLNVDPMRIAPALKLLRARADCAEIPLLVESFGLAGEQSLAGVLPSYRAMPCSHTEMLTLVSCYSLPKSRVHERRGML